MLGIMPEHAIESGTLKVRFFEDKSHQSHCMKKYSTS